MYTNVATAACVFIARVRTLIIVTSMPYQEMIERERERESRFEESQFLFMSKLHKQKAINMIDAIGFPCNSIRFCL